LRHRSSGGIGRHFTYSNVVSTIALFLVIGGGFAVAAGLKKNSVKSKQIASNAVKTAELNDAAVTPAELADNAVTTPKLADNAVTTPKLASDAVATPKLADNAATGAKVDENTLGKVPSAAAADTLGGKTANDLQTSSAFGSTAGGGGLGTTFATVAGATITTHVSGRIIATGSAQLDGQNGGETGECKLNIDGDDSLTYRSQVDDFATNPNEIVIAVNHAVIRPAGTYVVALLCRGTGGMDSFNKGNAAVAVFGLGT
jgi:hypothetical protein